MNARKIKIYFGVPRYGWLPVELNFGAFNINCSVSNVLNDPLEELLILISITLTSMFSLYSAQTYLYSFNAKIACNVKAAI
jgi:hypothetical protein